MPKTIQVTSCKQRPSQQSLLGFPQQISVTKNNQFETLIKCNTQGLSLEDILSRQKSSNKGKIKEELEQ